MMFTGLVEEVGIVKRVNKVSSGAMLVIAAKKIMQGLKIGDSIAVNGACQTVVEIKNETFSIEASFETLRLTNLNALKQEDLVNLERALAFGDRLGGHLVSGHIDGMAALTALETHNDFKTFAFKAPDDIMQYVVYKGSICLNGVSLTVSAVNDFAFEVVLIPHTLQKTNLPDLKIGALVNVEVDMIAKYVEKFVAKGQGKSDITYDFLKQNGFA